MSVYTKEDIIRKVNEEDVEFIRMQFTDIFGSFKNIAITIEELERALDGKVLFDSSAIEGFVRNRESDISLLPDPDTFEIFPWRPRDGSVARLICDVCLPDGSHFPGCSRSALKRVLKREGVFITQQVGCFTTANLLKDMLGSKASYGNWNLQSAINELERNGFTISDADEHITTVRFYDIGAIVYYLKAIPWLIEDFLPEKYYDELMYIHRRIERDGYYDILNHLFIITAETE